MELALPYLPILVALANYIALNDAEALAGRPGPAARELAQLFPQLGAPIASVSTDPPRPSCTSSNRSSRCSPTLRKTPAFCL